MDIHIQLVGPDNRTYTVDTDSRSEANNWLWNRLYQLMNNNLSVRVEVSQFYVSGEVSVIDVNSAYGKAAIELPGMWEEADLTGGETDDRTQP